MSEFNTEFKILWDTKVKKQIEKCTPEYENISRIESGMLSEEESNEIAKKIEAKGYKDIYGQYYIGSLVWAVEHALADDRKDLNFIQSISQVHGCLNDDGYWTNVFKNDYSSDEAKELLKLKELINEMYKLIF